MIPSDRWHDNGDGTAWLVVAGDPGEYSRMHDNDRPCDHCDGEPEGDCDCINGRHTFNAEVSCIEQHRADTLTICEHEHTHRVSVVEGMVLPIDETGIWPCRHGFITMTRDGEFWLLNQHTLNEPITLPPAAKPGMWAVKLARQRVGMFMEVTS